MPDAGHPLALRSRVLGAIRNFFLQLDFVEVETPVRIRAPAMEAHIDAEPSGDRWLRTSPELHMKRLLAEGWPRLFQMGPCFRSGERGALHHPEFTLLEWYRAPGDAAAILDDMRALLPAVARAAHGEASASRDGVRIALDGPWESLSIAEAFERHAGWNPVAAFDADRFDLDLVSKVEPALPRDRPVVLMEYPAAAAALARLKLGDPRVAERWELYLGGVEIANAFTELADPVEQRARFESCAADRAARGKPVYPIDEAFLAALARMPPAGGVALGVDRLTMLLAGADTLDAVLPFRD